MSIKKAMQKYFQMRRGLAAGGLDFLNKTPFNGDLLIYEGQLDEDGYISWQPVEMTETQSFVKLQNELNIQLHQSIVDYFNCYWFADLDGFYKGNYIALDPVLPNRPICSLYKALKEYKANSGGRLTKIPIGMDENGLLIVVENESGIIQLEDVESGTYEQIADDLQGLVGNMRLIRGE